MESFEDFVIEGMEQIYGGKLIPTYIGQYGDFYDDVNKRFILLLEN